MISCARPLNAIVFDCDGTLSSIEGISYLAEQNRQGDAVRLMTEQAMCEGGLNPLLFERRLALTQPTLEQCLALSEAYYQARTKYISEFIAAWQALGKQVFVLSAGYQMAVQSFAARIHVPKSHVFSVDLIFDQQGNYVDFDRASPFVHNEGKGEWLKQRQQEIGPFAYVGDGANDLIAQQYAECFVGFGAHFPRKSIAAACDVYIRENNAQALWPYVLTADEQNKMT